MSIRNAIQNNYTLIAKHDNESGELGYMLSDMKHNGGGTNVSLTGYGIAHDILEHQQGINNIGTIEDELIAIGGFLYIRGYDQKVNINQYDMKGAIANDIMWLASIFVWLPRTSLNNIPNKSDINIKSIVDNGDFDLLKQALRKGKSLLIKELEYADEDLDYKKINNFFKYVLRFVCLGYKLAEQRFDCLCQCDPRCAVNELFWKISSSLDDRFNEDIYVGKKLNLHISDHLVATVTDEYEYEYEYE